MTVSPKLHAVLRDHPLAIRAEQLAAFLGIGCDEIAFALFLSRVAIVQNLSVHIHLITNMVDVDQDIANRIAELDTTGVAWISTPGDMKDRTGAKLFIISSESRAVYDAPGIAVEPAPNCTEECVELFPIRI